jgi:hypothetical protein
MAVDATRPVAVLALGESASVAWRALWTSRVLVLAAGVAAVLIWGLVPRYPAFDAQGLTAPFGHSANTLLAPFARWDSKWYLDIARNGYNPFPPGRAAFFPLYPLLLALGGVLFGSPLIAGILISCVCAWVGLVLLHRLTEIELGRDAARHTVWLLAFSPMAFFFSAVYTESLFLLLSVGALLAGRTGRWPLAALAGVLAAATRNAGVLLVLPLLLLWWQRRDRARDLLWLAVIPVGLVAFMVWTATHNGGLLDTFHDAKLWNRVFEGPFSAVWTGMTAAWDGARQLLHGSRTPVYFKLSGDDPFIAATHDLTPIPFLLIGVALFAGAVRRLPPAYWAYAFVALLLDLSYPVPSQPLISLPRYELVIFPLFMYLGWWVSRGGRRRQMVTYGISAFGLVLATGQFATWHWVA